MVATCIYLQTSNIIMPQTLFKMFVVFWRILNANMIAYSETYFFAQIISFNTNCNQYILVDSLIDIFFLEKRVFIYYSALCVNLLMLKHSSDILNKVSRPFVFSWGFLSYHWPFNLEIAIRWKIPFFLSRGGKEIWEYKSKSINSPFNKKMFGTAR